MSPFKRGKVWYARIPHPNGGPGTVRRLSKDLRIAKDMERMLSDLKAREFWDVIRAILDKRRKLGAVYAEWLKDPSLRELRVSLDDVDLAPLVDEYERVVLIPKFGEGTDSRHSTRRAMQQIRSLIPEGKAFPRSKWTTGTIESFLAGLSCNEPTKVVYLSNLRQFEQWLVSRKVLTVKAIPDIQAKPKAGKPRKRFLTLADALKLADAQSEPFRTMEVLATIGFEFEALWALTAGHFDKTEKAVRAKGSKNETRDRWVPVPEWVWKYVEPHLSGKLPETPLFRVPLVKIKEPTQKQLRLKLYNAMNDSHREACKRLGISDYRLHDGRHTHTVRWLKAGAAPLDIGKTLGHADGRMVQRVYGQGYTPDMSDLHRWAKMADVKESEDTKESTGNG